MCLRVCTVMKNTGPGLICASFWLYLAWRLTYGSRLDKAEGFYWQTGSVGRGHVLCSHPWHQQRAAVCPIELPHSHERSNSGEREVRFFFFSSSDLKGAWKWGRGGSLTLPEARLTTICCLIAMQKTSLGYNDNVWISYSIPKPLHHSSRQFEINSQSGQSNNLTKHKGEIWWKVPLRRRTRSQQPAESKWWFHKARRLLTC